MQLDIQAMHWVLDLKQIKKSFRAAQSGELNGYAIEPNVRIQQF